MNYVVTSGQVTPSGLTLQDGDTLSVLNGGEALGVTLLSGSMETISAGGTGSENTVSGGIEYVALGATANFTTVSAGYQSIYGSASGSIDDGGTINVFGGGVTTSAVIENGSAEFIYRSGTTFGTFISSGDIYVSSGGKEDGATISGGDVFVYKGGTDSGSTVYAGAAVNVSSGGTASATTVANGGSVDVNSSGTAAGLVLQNGGTASAYAGGTVSGATVAAGGQLFAIGGGALTGSIANTGDVIFSLASNQSATFTGALSGTGILSVLGSGKLVLSGSDALTGGTLINFGSKLELTSGGSAGSGPITFTTNSGTLIIDGAAPTGVISGVTAASSDLIMLNALTYTSGGTTSVGQSGDFVTVTTPTGSATLDIAGSHAFNYTGAAGTGGAVVLTANAPCYVGGTLIATPGGEVPVESITAGDIVCVRGGGTAVVEWVGHGASRITEENRSDIAPVIVRRGALGDGLPRRDLHLTRRHGVVVGAVLIPVELLVNDRSVVWDEAAESISFHHIELEGHDILLAEGAPAESFRDDGSEHLFPNATTRRPGKPPVVSCIPVVTSGPLLEQAWRSVAERAGAVPDSTVTIDADVHLQHNGQRVTAYAVQDGVHRFRLNASGDVLLRSRHAIPASFQDGGDERRLGVALLGIELASANGSVRHTPHVLRGGVHPAEAPGHRWTKGRATLPAELFDGLDGEIELAIHVAGTISYRTPMGAVLN